MVSTVSDVAIHISDETNLWNRLALALSRDEQQPSSQHHEGCGEIRELLNHYESETKKFRNIYKQMLLNK